jgi:hypothetical protein
VEWQLAATIRHQNGSREAREAGEVEQRNGRPISVSSFGGSLNVERAHSDLLIFLRPLIIATVEHHSVHQEPVHTLARKALFSFIVIFILSRVVVFLIMSDEMPNLYFFLKGTHVHHLNYGIFLLAGVAGYSVFRRPTGKLAEATALLYGVAMGLTFDEFGMWLHLGGSYWQRASVDAVIVVAALFAFVGFARQLERYEAKHFWACVVLVLALLTFGVVLYIGSEHLGNLMGPTLHDLEAASSP